MLHLTDQVMAVWVQTAQLPALMFVMQVVAAVVVRITHQLKDQDHQEALVGAVQVVGHLFPVLLMAVMVQ